MAVRSGESRLRLLDLLQAFAKELLAVGVGRLLAKELLRAFAGKLSGVLGELVACVLESIVDFSPRAAEYLLRLGFSGRDQLALLTLALHLRALADLPNFTLELCQARLDVGGHLIRFGAPFARLFRLVLHMLVARGQRVLERLADAVNQHAEERHHVHEFPDPRRDAEEFGAFVLGAVLGIGTRSLGRCFLRAVRDRVWRLRLLPESGCAERDAQRSDERPHNGLPRIRSAARRASDSASRTILSRASFTSRLSRFSASAMSFLASAVVRSTSDCRCAPASDRNLSRSCAASRFASWSLCSILFVASLN